MAGFMQGNGQRYAHSEEHDAQGEWSHRLPFYQSKVKEVVTVDATEDVTGDTARLTRY